MYTLVGLKPIFTIQLDWAMMAATQPPDCSVHAAPLLKALGEQKLMHLREIC